MLVNTTASFNVAVGRLAMSSLTGGGITQNTAVGNAAMNLTTTGEFNTAVGGSALGTNTTGNNNTAIGLNALSSNTTGLSNTALGISALISNTTGGYNTALGYACGYNLTTGGGNVFIGTSADTNGAGSSNQIVIGDSITGQGSNYVSLGKASNYIYNQFTVNATWTRTSDIRIKQDIKNDNLGLDFINLLKPRTFKWKPSNEVPKELYDHYSEKNNMDLDAVMNGFIAQEVKEALDAVGNPVFGGWVIEKDGAQAISREMFIMPLINAVKELSAKVDALQTEINVLKGE
jgi:trimeric autotransporter adhesin